MLIFITLVGLYFGAVIAVVVVNMIAMPLFLVVERRRDEQAMHNKLRVEEQKKNKEGG